MTNDLREKYLTNLASTEGEDAQRALNKAGEKIASKLDKETRYDLIDFQLRYLSPISYRIPDLTISALKSLLKSLDALELTYQPIKWANEKTMQRFYSKDDLRRKVVKILEGLRYIRTSEVFDILLENSASENESVKKTTIDALKSIVSYNITVFFGDDGHQGIGPKPQEDILEKMQSLDTSKRAQYFSALLAICNEILSPTMEAAQWNYRTVTVRTRTVPVHDRIISLRRRTLEYVADLFSLASSPSRKKEALHILLQAAHLPSHADRNDKFREMVLSDTLHVLKLFERFVVDAPLEIIQSLEHDAFWVFRRFKEDAIAESALRVRDAINANQEYQIFKVLIGFEGVFEEWEYDRNTPDFADIDKYRDTRAKEFALSVSTENYDAWRDRILSYAQIQSDDLATFPVFGKFLNYFAEASPTLALKLLTSDASTLDRFLPGLLIGVWSTDKKDDVKGLMNRWIDQNLFLFQIARTFEFTPDVDMTLLMRLFDKAREIRDLNTLAEMVPIATVHAASGSITYLEKLFIPAITALTEFEDSRWIFGFWFRKQREQVLTAMSINDIKTILTNLVYLKALDFHAEEVLAPIAERHPDLVINYFAERIAREKSLNGEYEAIPFELHKLGSSLARHADMAFEIISGWPDDELSRYRGIKLLSEIFKESIPDLSSTLIKVAKSGDIDKIDVALAALRNFHGEIELHPAFKELVRTLSDDEARLNEVAIAMLTTGVVGGEFGFVEAWRNKQDEVKPWLEDSDVRVRRFARKYIDELGGMIDAEQRRAEESIKLEKFQWGDDQV